MFDACPSPSLLPLFEPELEFFVFPPGGVALTEQIRSTQTNCSTTPAATVSKTAPRSACLYPQHPPSASCTPVSMATISHTCLHGYHLACLCPWLRPSTAPLHLPVPHITSNPACCLTLLAGSLDLNTSKPMFKYVFCAASHFILN